MIGADTVALVHGQRWAYGAGVIPIALGALFVWCCVPAPEDEKRLLSEHAGEGRIAVDACATTDAV